jgi:hypothetical protein
MKWNDQIESLRSFVLWECKDLPPDLVLAIIRHESGGKIGRIGQGKTRCGDLPDVYGNKHELCHASGLMQTIPATVAWYNDTAPDDQRATIEDMTGTDDRAARIQIRIGCKYLAYVNHYLHNRFPSVFPAASLSQANDDQISFVLTGYAVGHGDTAEKIQGLLDAGKKTDFKTLKATFPDWGRVNGVWLNRPIQYAQSVMAQFNKHRGGSYDSSKPGDLVRRTIGDMTKGKGALAAILFIGGAAWLINHHFTKPRGIE